MNGFSVAFAHVRSSSRCLTEWPSILAWISINFLIDVLLVHVSDMSCLKTVPCTQGGGNQHLVLPSFSLCYWSSGTVLCNFQYLDQCEFAVCQHI